MTTRETLITAAADVESGRVAASPLLAREHAAALRALAARIDEEEATTRRDAAKTWAREGALWAAGLIARLDADLLPGVDPEASKCAAWCGCLADAQPREFNGFIATSPTRHRQRAFCTVGCMLAGRPLNPASQAKDGEK